jgi:predicted transglutaminase-like cysteine proteinase
MGAFMGKVLLPALLAVVISACAADAIELHSPGDPADHPFGMTEFEAPEGVSKDKWQKIKADILAELPKLSKCQTDLDSCTSTSRKFEDIVKEAERHEGLAKIAFINALINALIDYQPDRNQWGVADQWTAPFVNKKGAFETGQGDCEDYAITKRHQLIELGWSTAELRLAVTRTASGEGHLVLVARTAGGDVVLDNRTDAIRRWNRSGLSCQPDTFTPNSFQFII